MLLFSKIKSVKFACLLFLFTSISVIGLQSPTVPAENISLNYDLLEFNIKVEDLELFAKQGKVTNELNFYLKRISPERREELKEFLNQSFDVNPVLIYRYSRTSVGIKILKRIGEIIQTPHNINGFYGLRGALIQTAAASGKVSLIEFLKNYPTEIQINLPELLKLIQQITKEEETTANFIKALQQKSIGTKQDFNTDLDLANKGNYGAIKQTLEFYDTKRDRKIVTDLYLPQKKSDSIPLILVSNGLGAKRSRFSGLAQYLTSHGFAVVIPDHPGSDSQRQKDFLKGLYKENFAATDFIDRPLDISYILDELEKINSNKLQKKLNLKQVGIFGYSIGGTTALSLAGAEINFDKLEKDCSQPLSLFNISTLYQCRALELDKKQPSLKDARIKAAYMFVPFGNSMFSEEQLNKVNIPTMIQVVDRDFLTSLLVEQIPLFNSLNSSDSFLVVSEKLPHSNVTLSKEKQAVQGEIFQIARDYQKMLSLIFFQNYIAENKAYKPYLTTEYLQEVAQEPYNLHLVNEAITIENE